MYSYKRLIVRLVVFFWIFNVVAYEQRPLKILFVVDHFPSLSQIFVLNIITGLIDNGHNVSIFSFHKDHPVVVHPNIEKYKLLDRIMYGKLLKKLPDYDVVFCQFGYLGKRIFELISLKSWLKKRKVAVCFRGSDLTAHMKNDPKMYKKLFKKADLFLPVCDYFKKRLVDLGCPSDKVVVHHSAIDCSQFFFKTREKNKDDIINLVSVCRLVEKKGIDIAINAVAQVIQHYPHIHYAIVGDGPERLYLEKLITTLNIVDHVTLCGWQTQKEVVTILNKSDIFLLPSVTGENGDEEGIANALKESMAMGLLSIGTWHAGTPELIEDGVSGFLVEQKNSKQLAKTIEHIIEHPEIWEPVGLAARQKIEQEFETHSSVKKLEKIFYQLLG